MAATEIPVSAARGMNSRRVMRPSIILRTSYAADSVRPAHSSCSTLTILHAGEPGIPRLSDTPECSVNKRFPVAPEFKG